MLPCLLMKIGERGIVDRVTEGTGIETHNSPQNLPLSLGRTRCIRLLFVCQRAARDIFFFYFS